MPVQLSDLVAKRVRSLTVDLGKGDELAITYSPDALTKTVYAGLQAAQDAKDPFTVAETVIVPLVRSWDLEDKGKPYPIDAEHVGALGLAICQAITLALFTDINEPDATGKGSPNGS